MSAVEPLYPFAPPAPDDETWNNPSGRIGRLAWATSLGMIKMTVPERICEDKALLFGLEKAMTAKLEELGITFAPSDFSKRRD